MIFDWFFFGGGGLGVKTLRIIETILNDEICKTEKLWQNIFYLILVGKVPNGLSRKSLDVHNETYVGLQVIPSWFFGHCSDLSLYNRIFGCLSLKTTCRPGLSQYSPRRTLAQPPGYIWGLTWLYTKAGVLRGSGGVPLSAWLQVRRIRPGVNSSEREGIKVRTVMFLVPFLQRMFKKSWKDRPELERHILERTLPGIDVSQNGQSL